jgi:predicted N-acyltransferase
MSVHDISVEVVDSIDRIGRESIDSLSDDGFFTYGWFKTLEESKLFNFVPRYLVAYAKEKIIAIAPSFISYDIRYFPDNNPLTKIANDIVNCLGLNCSLVCCSPGTFHTKILFRKNCERTSILDLLSKKIDDLSTKEKIRVSSFSVVSEFDRLLMENLQDLGYLKVPFMHTLYLDIRWSSFDSYLNSLKRKVRRNVRREIRKCRECGVTIEEEKEFGDLAITLSDLYGNLFFKYNGNTSNPVSASFFRELGRYAKDKTRVFIARKNNKIVGFSLSLQHRDVLDVYMSGFDYELQTNKDFTYFNTVYYAPIKLAIEENIRRIDFSATMDDVKLRRGCKIERLYWFVKVHNKLLRPLASLYVQRKRASRARLS